MEPTPEPLTSVNFTAEQNRDSDEAQDLANSLFDRWGSFIPMTVAHYTSFETVCRILSGPNGSASLFASDADYLNDTTELQYYPRMLHNAAVDRYGDSLPVNEYILRATYRWAAEKLNTTYAASFTWELDDLTQWRLYGDDGAGAAIVLDTDALQAPFFSSPYAHFRPCRYPTEGDLRTQANEFFDVVEPLLQQRGWGSERAEFFLEVALGASLELEAPTVKLPDYSGEQECRAVFRSIQRRRSKDDLVSHLAFPGGASFPRLTRFQSGGLIPYTTLDITDAVRGVTLGPKVTGDFTRQAYALRAMVDGRAYEQMDIKPSKHPYRG